MTHKHLYSAKLPILVVEVKRLIVRADRTRRAPCLRRLRGQPRDGQSQADTRNHAGYGKATSGTGPDATKAPQCGNASCLRSVVACLRRLGANHVMDRVRRIRETTLDAEKQLRKAAIAGVYPACVASQLVCDGCGTTTCGPRPGEQVKPRWVQRNNVGHRAPTLRKIGNHKGQRRARDPTLRKAAIAGVYPACVASQLACDGWAQTT